MFVSASKGVSTTCALISHWGTPPPGSRCIVKVTRVWPGADGLEQPLAQGAADPHAFGLLGVIVGGGGDPDRDAAAGRVDRRLAAEDVVAIRDGPRHIDDVVLVRDATFTGEQTGLAQVGEPVLEMVRIAQQCADRIDAGREDGACP